MPQITRRRRSKNRSVAKNRTAELHGAGSFDMDIIVDTLDDIIALVCIVATLGFVLLVASRGRVAQKSLFYPLLQHTGFYPVVYPEETCTRSDRGTQTDEVDN